MEIVIEHSKTKRKIDGPFAICASKSDLLKLKQAIDHHLEDSEYRYGWISIDEIGDENESFICVKKQKSITNQPPVGWD